MGLTGESGMVMTVAGNVTRETVKGAEGETLSTSYRYDLSDRLIHEVSQSGAVNRCIYDQNGRLLKEIRPYAYEAETDCFHCTLMTMPGIDLATAANLLSEIGNIDRFPNSNKLAKFAGIAPVNFSSAGKGKDMCPKRGNRRLQAIFYFLAIQMVQVAPSGTARHPVFLEYYLRKQEEGKNKHQALICIARRLVNIVYGMLKNHTEYREPERRTGEETV